PVLACARPPSPRECVEQTRAARPELPSARRARLQEAWGITAAEMINIRNAGALDLVEQTIAAGASPADARKWWLNELARRANDTGAELASLPITPADGAAVAALRASGRPPRPTWPRSGRSSPPARSTTGWPARSSRACWPERGPRTRWWRPAA